MHLAGWYLDFRIVCPPCWSREFQFRITIFSRISLEKKSRAVVSWVLNNPSENHHSNPKSSIRSRPLVKTAFDFLIICRPTHQERLARTLHIIQFHGQIHRSAKPIGIGVVTLDHESAEC